MEPSRRVRYYYSNDEQGYVTKHKIHKEREMHYIEEGLCMNKK